MNVITSRIPAMSSHTVRRTALLHVLARWRELRLVRIVAPAGFGKSTLGRMWVDSILSDQDASSTVRAVWQHLEPADRAPSVFLRHLGAHVIPFAPALEDLFRLADSDGASPAHIIEELCVALAALPGHTVFVFDDVHRLDDSDTLPLLQHLLDHAADALHVVLISRTRPALQFARLQLADRMLSLSASELALDDREFNAFVAGTRLAALPSAQLERLRMRSGGWVAGLQMLAQIVPATGAATADFLSSSIAAEDLWDFTRHEVLHNMPSALQAFLVSTSLLPRLDAAVCAVVTGRTIDESANLLHAAASTCSLIQPTLDADGWRVHPVLREFLQHRLFNDAPAAHIRDSRRRAAAHLAESDDVDAALDLLLPSADADPMLQRLGADAAFAAALVETACRTALPRTQLGRIQSWIARLPRSVIESSPRLALDAAWVVAFHTDGALHNRLSMVRTAFAHTANIPVTLSYEAETLEAYHAAHEGRYAQAMAHARRASELRVADNPLVDGYLKIVEGFVQYGDKRTLDARVRDYGAAIASFGVIGFTRGQIEAMICENWTRRIYADGPSILSCVRRTRSFISESSIDPGQIGVMLHLFAADALYSTNHLADCEAELDLALVQAHRSGSLAAADYQIRILRQLCALARGETPFIDDEADHAEWLRSMSGIPTLPALTTAIRRVHRDQLRKRADQCRATAELLAPDPSSLSASTPVAAQLAVLTGYVAARRHLREVPALLASYRTHMEAVNHHFMALHAHALQIVVLKIGGNLKRAAIELASLLPRIEHTNFVRVILDQPTLRPLVEQDPSRFAAHLLTLQWPDAEPSTSAVLTTQERRILVAIGEGRAVDAVAVDFDISPNTVRTHLKRIYTKLDVHNMRAAVSKAREAGLI